MRYEELEQSNFRRPLILNQDSPVNKFVAYVDPDQKLNETDKLSQVSLSRERNVGLLSTLHFQDPLNLFTLAHFLIIKGQGANKNATRMTKSKNDTIRTNTFVNS